MHEWTNASWALEVISVEGTEDMPVQHGRSTLEYDAADGQHRVSVVDFILIWRRADDGRYRIAVDAYWAE